MPDNDTTRIDIPMDEDDDEDEECAAEIHSWSVFRPEQIDSYWIRCTLQYPHEDHEDSHTGIKWKSRE